jgi:DNA-binding CsgD family transcriptional regulator
LYGLTPAEARIAELLVGGATPAQVATELGLRGSTVKTHLLRVYEKTGVHRQSDLIRLAASLSVTHRR